ncbi:LOW QUALITY PROTEIN: hypothetical protein MAR_021083, partial [Mya arenaria]
MYINENIPFYSLRLVFSCTAGSGKSYLIQCIIKAVRLHFKYNKSVQVVCPTGNSANVINGVTLHSYLKVPTKKQNREMSAPQGSRGDVLQNNVEVHLVDEWSLTGANTIGWMEFMCRHGIEKGINSDKSWGGLP